MNPPGADIAGLMKESNPIAPPPPSPASVPHRPPIAAIVLPKNDDEPPQGGWIWAVVVVLVLAAAAAAIYYFYGRSGTSTSTAARRAAMAARPVPVVSAVSRVGDLPQYLTGLGNVIPLKSVTVRTRVDGQVDSVSFVEGQLIHEGELLAQIDPRPFQVQQKQAEGQLAKDQAAYNVAKINVQRDKEALAANAIAAQLLDTDQSAMDQATAAMKVDQSQIDSAKLQLTYCKVTSPITGRIGLRLVDPGNIVHASDSTGIAVIAQRQPITLVFSLPEDVVGQVEKKINAGETLGVDAFDRDMKIKLATGTLLASDNQIDPTTGMLKFKAIFPNEDDSLFPNQFANARLLIDTVQNAVLVPTDAVQHGLNSATFVYVVKFDAAGGEAEAAPAGAGRGAGGGGGGGGGARQQGAAAGKPGTVEMHDVVVGPSEGDMTVIASGLNAGETVVTEGVDKLTDGSKVTVHSAEEAAAATAANNSATTRPARMHGGGKRGTGAAGATTGHAG
jgi:membrane fusion protein, multidrug efflux system